MGPIIRAVLKGLNSSEHGTIVSPVSIAPLRVWHCMSPIAELYITSSDLRVTVTVVTTLHWLVARK